MNSCGPTSTPSGVPSQLHSGIRRASGVGSHLLRCRPILMTHIRLLLSWVCRNRTSSERSSSQGRQQPRQLGTHVGWRGAGAPCLRYRASHTCFPLEHSWESAGIVVVVRRRGSSGRRAGPTRPRRVWRLDLQARRRGRGAQPRWSMPRTIRSRVRPGILRRVGRVVRIVLTIPSGSLLDTLRRCRSGWLMLT